MTGIRLKVLAWVSRYCDEKGYSPTLREMCQAFEWASPNSAKEYTDSLVAVGLVERTPNLSRTLKVTKAGQELLASLDAEAIASCNAT